MTRKLLRCVHKSKGYEIMAFKVSIQIAGSSLSGKGGYSQFEVNPARFPDVEGFNHIGFEREEPPTMSEWWM